MALVDSYMWCKKLLLARSKYSYILHTASYDDTSYSSSCSGGLRKALQVNPTEQKKEGMYNRLSGRMGVSKMYILTKRLKKRRTMVA